MATYIAFLRAINLAGRRTFSPSQIVACLEAAGFTDVATHINTGNVRLTTRMRSPERIRVALERAFLDDRGFEVPVCLFTPAEVRALADSLDEIGAGHPGQHHVSLLQAVPDAAGVAAVEGLGHPDERAVVRGRAVHLLMRDSAHSSRLSNTVVERHLGTATARNSTVIRAVAAKWA